MRRNLFLLQLALMMAIGVMGAERKYLDAYIFGALYGNPSEMVIETEKEGSVIYRFNEDGAVTYIDGEVKNLVRDEKGRLVSFENGMSSYVIGWDNNDMPYKIRYKTFATQLVTGEFFDEHYDIAPQGDYFTRSQLTTKTMMNKNGKKENVTLSVLQFRNQTLDEYGNVKFQIRHYTQSGTLDFPDKTMKISIKYWSDRMTDIDISQRNGAFGDLLLHPADFHYDVFNKRNLYQQLYMDFLPQSGYQHISYNLPRGRYASGWYDYKGIPYQVFYYDPLGDDADFYIECYGTEHEMRLLEQEFIQHCEN